MDGITGLQLLDTATRGATSGIGLFGCIILFILGVIAIILGGAMLILDDSVGGLV